MVRAYPTMVQITVTVKKIEYTIDKNFLWHCFLLSLTGFSGGKRGVVSLLFSEHV